MQEAFQKRLQQAIAERPVDVVAQKAGIDRRTLRRGLRGNQKIGMRVDVIEAIAHACGVSPGWLAFGESDG